MTYLERPKDKDKIYYSLPDFYGYYQLNINLIMLMRKYPGWFRDNVVVDSMYGSFPGVIWNGGRTAFGGSTADNIIATISGINQLGVSIRFTFTNRLITGRHHYDYYGNQILTYAHNGMNGVNTGSASFADYIREKYPDYYLISSTTRKISGVDELNELSEKMLVVPPYTINNTEAIEKLEHKENIELLCCEACIDNCPNRSKHYDMLSEAQMYQVTEPYTCPHGCEIYYFYDLVPTRKHHITPEMIESMYLPRGLNQFKISGRNDNVINVIERYVYYLAKPEFKDTVRNHLLLDQFSGYNQRPNPNNT